MNKRIKQLALDAGIGFTLWDDSGREMIDNYTPEERLAKFAELIVRECSQIAEQPHEYIKTQSGKQILKHFGIEG